MCLIVKVGCKVKKAQNDIKVYKLVNKHWNYWSPMYQQEYRQFKYREPIAALNKFSDPVRNLKINHHTYVDQISTGFHSKVSKHHYTTNTICIIPKGSEICYGIHDDIVSNQIIVFKNYFQYLIYKLKKHFKHE